MSGRKESKERKERKGKEREERKERKVGKGRKGRNGKERKERKGTYAGGHLRRKHFCFRPAGRSLREHRLSFTRRFLAVS